VARRRPRARRGPAVLAPSVLGPAVLAPSVLGTPVLGPSVLGLVVPSLARRGLAGRSPLVPGVAVLRLAVLGLARWEGPARRWALAGRSHPTGGWWHGLLWPTGLAGRSPAGTRSWGRVWSGLVAGLRWGRAHAARRRLGLTRRAAGWAARRGRPERLASALRSRRRPRGDVGSRRPGRSRGTRRPRVARNIDQATGRVHGGRIQHPLPPPPPFTGRPGRPRGPVPVTSGPAASPSPAPGERENYPGDQANRETRHDQGHAQEGDMTARAPADQMGGHARDDQDSARYDHQRADHPQGDDKPHPPGRGGI
jgi:hypothetical protein